MYKIRNISNGKIQLGDLDNLIIKKDDEIDLDLFFTRERVEKSPSLRYCLHPDHLKLQVIHKDHIPPHVDPKDLEEMEKRLRAQIVEQMTMQPMPQEQSSVAELKAQLDFLIKYVTTQPLAQNVVSPTNVSQKPTEEDEDDTEKTIAIQEKLLKRLSKNVESSVESKQDVKASDINKRVDELENLI